MRLLFFLLLAIHGLIHLMGFGKAFGYAAVSPIRQSISASTGLLWLATAAAFITAGALFALHQGAWWAVALPAALLSQVLIFLAWGDAKFGTIANLLVLLPAFAIAVDSRSGYQHRYGDAVRQSLAARPSASGLVTEAGLAHLPPVVQQYLRGSGALGQPKVHNFRILFHGTFRNGLESSPMAFHSEQVNTIDPPSRAFLMSASMRGLPAQGLHLFHHGHATMQIKLASLFQVVDARGPEMDQSETVTLFNDLCLFAPAALIDRERIQWEAAGPLSVRASFRHLDRTIHARLIFNENAELIDFISTDRYYSSDGKTYQSYPWSTPVHGYTAIAGRKVPGRASAVWHTPQGQLVYGGFNLAGIAYNWP